MTSLRIIPLGGLGEVGMNCMVLEDEDHAIILDCGTMASHHPWLGFDFIVPDFAYLKSIQHKIRALIITHGHEDHVGAIPFLLRELQIPKMYCSPYTYEIIKLKLNNEEKSQTDFEIISLQKEISVANFNITYFPVTHSIMESHLLYIESPYGNILHTGDFKIDKKPYIPWKIDWEALKKLKVDLLLSDSTNSEKKGRSVSEEDLFASLCSKYESAIGNIYICFFASHLARMQIALDAAKKHGKKVFLAGNSMFKFFDINQRLGYLKTDGITILTDNDEINLDKNELVVFCTGTQGEYLSAISKILRDENPKLKIKPQDTFILSALKIPGNEINVRYLINALAAKGCRIFHSSEDIVHASGHAYQEEQKEIIQFFKPKFFMPVHGDLEMLRTHAMTAKAVNQEVHCEVLIDGEVAHLSPQSFTKSLESVPASKRWVRGQRLGGMDSLEIKERKRIARDGLVIATLLYENGKLFDQPKLEWIGCSCEEDLKAQITKDFAVELKTQPYLKEEAELLLSRIIRKYLGHRPLVKIINWSV